MKAEKPHKIREMSDGELQARERDLEERIFRVKFQAATTQGEGLSSLHVLKTERARVKTVLRERLTKKP